MSLDTQQQAKWNELDTFFKANSKYYKQIDNDDVVFNTWVSGAGGDFFTTLFLDSMLDVRYLGHQMLKYLTHYNRWQQIIPCMEMRLNAAIWVNDTLENTQDEVQYLQQQYLLVDYVYNLYILFELPPKEFIAIIDNIFKDALTCHITVKNTQHYKAHNLPVIPYFYYKTFAKVKTILLGYTEDETLRFYIDVLKLTKNFHWVDKTTKQLRLDLFPPGTSLDIIKEASLYYNSILESVDNINVVRGVIAEVLLKCLKENKYDVDKSKQNFIEHLKNYAQRVSSIDLNTIELADADDWIATTAKPYSGMLNLLLNESLYKIDYRKLVIEQDTATIEQMMQLYNSNQDVSYYKTQMQMYHERNIKLFNQLKIELPLVVEKL
jgi:hypothetical protein